MGGPTALLQDGWKLFRQHCTSPLFISCLLNVALFIGCLGIVDWRESKVHALQKELTYSTAHAQKELKFLQDGLDEKTAEANYLQDRLDRETEMTSSLQERVLALERQVAGKTKEANSLQGRLHQQIDKNDFLQEQLLAFEVAVLRTDADWMTKTVSSLHEDKALVAERVANYSRWYGECTTKKLGEEKDCTRDLDKLLQQNVQCSSKVRELEEKYSTTQYWLWGVIAIIVVRDCWLMYMGRSKQK